MQLFMVKIAAVQASAEAWHCWYNRRFISMTKEDEEEYNLKLASSEATMGMEC